jgi:xylulokinase
MHAKTHTCRRSTTTESSWFLGFDFSTQRLKATAVDETGAVVQEAAVEFDADLPAFQTRGGVHRHPDGLTVTSPSLLWVAALDLLLKRLASAGFPFGRVSAISGSGQQHGSVYWRAGAAATLAGLRSDRTLADQLADAFAVADSPIWMDSSTSRQCRERDAALGGPQAVADLTGSRSYERFTGNQIARIFQEQPQAYEATERISLVSSFGASLLIGGYAPIEPGDGAGMNLMDLRARTWSPRALDVTAPGLAARLGPIVPSHTVVGRVAACHAVRWGFRPDTLVIAFSGDNPCSLAGLRLDQPGDIAISLGTSDTVFGVLRAPKPSASEGHIFGNPTDPDGYMALICYKNGSLTREAVRDANAGGRWDRFDAALDRTRPGNGGKLAFFFKEPEITPPVLRTGTFRFAPDGRPAAMFTDDEHIRAVVEGQFLSMRLHGGNIGLVPKRLLATGGASVNTRILQVMADVFGAAVYTTSRPNSASLGAALRAIHGAACHQAGRFIPFRDAIRSDPGLTLAASPRPDAHLAYTELLPRYAKLEAGLLEG